ncbi:MAG: sulfite exporter TauE/SafE family protein [Bacteriovoracaceae bacterium]|nr:sulfite exporter TauE/SafE family protein [Bacteriovoracaceae bacterium]
MTFIFLILAGLFIGIFAPVFGVGGGIIAVPSMHAVASGLPAQTIVGCSLFMICLNSIINTWKFKRNNVEIKLNIAGVISCAMTIGVILGGKFVLQLDAQTIKLIFATIILLIAVKIIIFKKKQTSELPSVLTGMFWIKCVLTGFIGGVVSGLTGLGGGAVLVPLMITLLSLPLKLISPYRQFSMAVGTLFGSLAYFNAATPTLPGDLAIIQSFQIGQINIAITLALVLGAMTTSGYGVKFSKKMPEKLAKKLFAGLLTIVSLKIFYSQLF